MKAVTRDRLEAALWGLALTAAVTGAVGWRRAGAEPAQVPKGTLSEPAAPRVFAADSLKAAARAVVARDPFRLERRPAAVAYAPELEGVPAAPPPPRPPRPALVVGGIIGGPKVWAALLSGVPGREGSVLVRKGDVFGDLAVRSVGRDTVVVSGADTTWRLGVRQ